VKALLLAALLQSPQLEIHSGQGWIALPGFTAGDSAIGAAELRDAIAWRDSASWLRVGVFDVRAGGSLRNNVAILDVDPAQVRFTLGLTAPGSRRLAADWINADTSLLMAVNTGLFRENGTPQGLVLLDGRRASALAGWLDAVIAIDANGPRATDLEGARALESGYAFQTLPWLVRDGRVALADLRGPEIGRSGPARVLRCAGRARPARGGVVRCRAVGRGDLGLGRPGGVPARGGAPAASRRRVAGGRLLLHAGRFAQCRRGLSRPHRGVGVHV